MTNSVVNHISSWGCDFDLISNYWFFFCNRLYNLRWSDLLCDQRGLLLFFCWLDYCYWVLFWFNLLNNCRFCRNLGLSDWLSNGFNIILYCFGFGSRSSGFRLGLFSGRLFGWRFLRCSFFGSSSNNGSLNWWFLFCCFLLFCRCLLSRSFLCCSRFRLWLNRLRYWFFLGSSYYAFIFLFGRF